MPVYRVVFRPSAFRRLLRLEPAERDDALRAIDSIRADPSPDGINKRPLPFADQPMTLYDSDLVWLTYRLVGPDEVSIVTVVAWGVHRPL